MIPKPMRERGLGIFVVSMFISPEPPLINS